MRFHRGLVLASLLAALPAPAGVLAAQQPTRPPAGQPTQRPPQPFQRPAQPVQPPAEQPAATPAAAAARDTARLDSLAARVAAAEEALERLRTQLAEQDQSKVGARLRNRVELSGLVLMNLFANNAKVNNSDVPQFVAPDPDTTGLPNSHMGMAVRQTRLGLAVSGVQVLGGGLAGDLQLDFFGGQQASGGGRTHPLLRIRTATARIDWPHVGLLFGQEAPLVSPLNPVSFASSGFPGFAGAGNLWLWIPQARATVEMGTRFRFGLQGAALAPMTPNAQGEFLTQPDSAEKSGRPTVQGRAYVGWGDGDAESQIGFGVHRGWIATSSDALIGSEAFTVDARLALGERILIQGEGFFNGQALAGLGGGGIGQNLGVGSVPVRTQGAWAQLNVRPTFAWEVGGGYGFDDPEEADLVAATGRGKNVVITGHLHWRPGGGLLTGLEFRRLETTYAAGTAVANHINWFVGVAF